MSRAKTTARTKRLAVADERERRAIVDKFVAERGIKAKPLVTNQPNRAMVPVEHAKTKGITTRPAGHSETATQAMTKAELEKADALETLRRAGGVHPPGRSPSTRG
jgi:hypothetical protein